MAETEYKANIRYAGDDLFVGTSPSGTSVAIDVRSSRHSAPSPIEMLLMAVAACTAADIVSILEKKRQDVREYLIEVTGSRVEEHPRKFSAFHVHHIVRGHNVSEQGLAQAIRLSDEKYCSVAATVRPTATVTSSYEIIEIDDQELPAASD